MASFLMPIKAAGLLWYAQTSFNAAVAFAKDIDRLPEGCKPCARNKPKEN